MCVQRSKQFVLASVSAASIGSTVQIKNFRSVFRRNVYRDLVVRGLRKARTVLTASNKDSREISSE